jgi:hypothetical protein
MLCAKTSDRRLQAGNWQRLTCRLTIDRRIVQDSQRMIAQLLPISQRGGSSNTAYIERLNATFGQRLTGWVARCSRHLPDAQPLSSPIPTKKPTGLTGRLSKGG